MIILKIGGGEKINLNGIVSDLSELDEKFIIVHGANWFRDKLARDLGAPKRIVKSVSGYESVFSDENAIDLLMMSYAGLRNKRIVELCQQNGINAVGLSGLDGRLVRGKRNAGIRVREDGKLKILRDFSGKPKEINLGLINLLLDNGYVPIICVPIIDENGCAINCENDDIVNVLQASLRADKIINLIEEPGLLSDKNNPTSLIKNLSQSEIFEREQKAEGRIKRKLLSVRKLMESENSTVIISDGRVEHPVLDALNGGGTVIK